MPPERFIESEKYINSISLEIFRQWQEAQLTLPDLNYGYNQFGVSVKFVQIPDLFGIIAVEYRTIGFGSLTIPLTQKDSQYTDHIKSNQSALGLAENIKTINPELFSYLYYKLRLKYLEKQKAFVANFTGIINSDLQPMSLWIHRHIKDRDERKLSLPIHAPKKTDWRDITPNRINHASDPVWVHSAILLSQVMNRQLRCTINPISNPIPIR